MKWFNAQNNDYIWEQELTTKYWSLCPFQSAMPSSAGFKLIHLQSISVQPSFFLVPWVSGKLRGGSCPLTSHTDLLFVRATSGNKGRCSLIAIWDLSLTHVSELFIQRACGTSKSNCGFILPCGLHTVCKRHQLVTIVSPWEVSAFICFWNDNHAFWISVQITTIYCSVQ